MNIILASASPRRRELLERMGLRFSVRTADHDETMDLSADPEAEVRRVSELKARAVEQLCEKEDLIIAADTIVVCQGKILGEPADEAEAYEMLRLLSGREHRVITGLCVLKDGISYCHSEVTHLSFVELTDRQIRAYIATGEPMDKAGAYGIQGRASVFVPGIRGDYYNVMGLPVCALAQILEKCGIVLPAQ
ncbi:MAG: septum formation protein Maf [Oscillospiraceae bacterium]|nr:septum formation protein Maf [Oscillospiraceae bacterium]